MTARGRPRSFDREAVLRKAMQVFWEKGFDGASMAELSAAMGIAPPSIYAAFGSKDRLFREAADLYGHCEGAEIWEAMETAATGRQAVEEYLLRSAQSFSRPGKPRGCMIVLGALHPDESNAEASRDLQRRRAGNFQDVKARLERAIAEGELAPDTDAAALARFYVTVQQGMSIQARDGATRDELTEVAKTAMAAWPEPRPA